MTRTLIFLCNAIDDVTRIERAIVTDSPAASRKVFLSSRAVRLTGVRTFVLSLGRGRQDGSGRRFSWAVRRVAGVPVVYLPFVHRRFLSELVSLLAPVLALWRFRRFDRNSTVVFYNRLAAYVPALFAARFFRFHTVLALEDGEIVPDRLFAGLGRYLLRALFDSMCSGGALLACSKLEQMTTLRPTLNFYGTCEPHLDKTLDWRAQALTVLMCGTISYETGASILAEAIRILRAEKPAWCERIEFEITGKGSHILDFEHLAQDTSVPKVTAHGRLTDVEYKALLKRSHVGLALKLNAGDLADTTFPSKVTEFASAGILVLTTDISDVRKLMGRNAIYLEEDEPRLLLERLRWVVENRVCSEQLAREGAKAIWARCAPNIAGNLLVDFLFGPNK